MNNATDQSSGWNDRKIELIVGQLLRAGVLISAGVVALGAVLFLVQQGSGVSNYRVFAGAGSLNSLAGIWSAAMHLEARGVIAFGLLVLVATPVLRVAFSAVAFAVERDWLYVGVTLVVLVVLLWGLLGGQQ